MTQAEALTILKTGANVFLTGEPGAGKSYTVNSYVAYLRAHGVEPAITASTGIAATHIHGMTIHSWSGIGIRKHLSPYDVETLAATEYLHRRISNAKVLIIDEVSMIDAATLDAVNVVCQAIRQHDAPFGGLQVVLVGDFFQLPPVVSRGGEPAEFAFFSRAWKDMSPLVCYLTEQHRQSDDRLLSLLSAIRNNTSMAPHMALLESRLITDDDVFDHEENITRLFSHNADVDTINAQALSCIDDVVTQYTMTATGTPALIASLKKGCLSPETLELKRGAIVMCTKNNQAKGFVNGTIGTVKRFSSSVAGGGAQCPIIETADGSEILIEPMEWRIEENGKVKAAISQLPLRLAWAITIHKSQGVSLDRALMDLRQVFEYGQGYVALSRVRTVHGMYLAGWNEQTFKVHPAISEQDELFHAQSDTAAKAFSELGEEDITAVQHGFILKSGGTIAAKKVRGSGSAKQARSLSDIKKGGKKDTLLETKALLQQKKSMTDIAELRSLTVTTILGHIEKLAESKRIGWEDISYLYTKQVLQAVPEVQKAFAACKTELLTPVREHLKNKYSFDTIRLARVAGTLQGV